jgi:hypothetical protein
MSEVHALEEGTYLLRAILAKCDDDGGCMMWTGGVGSDDVPKMRIPGDTLRRTHSVRALVLREIGKPLPEGNIATNTCERKRCVAPDHAVAMTRSRLGKRAAESTGYHLNPARNAKIAAAHQAKFGVLSAEVRAAIDASSTSNRATARALGVPMNTVADYRRGDTYRNYSTPFRGLGARS